ncbi:unnamed protein product [Orchesella dallaii]|uniref:Uncharacterized protein n=1 Tax=Orchesella dallaii TaxID=48710 RepID=A0ABP1Q8F4_9HEXA
MKTLTLVLAFAAVASAQKALKGGKHKPAYIATSPGAGLHGGDADIRSSPYQAASPQSQSHHGGSYSGHGGGHGSPSFSSGIGKASSKATYPLLLSDTRTLNTDGTINFNYQADNGLHQGESVDSDGTRRGFYSYPGADGKLITVKYTAGKNGFVAEGDHLPTQPQSAPYNPKQESHDLYSPKQGSQSSHGGLGGHGGHGQGGHNQYSSHAPSALGSGAYRPSHGSGHHGGGHGSHGGGSSLGLSAGAGGNHFSHSSGGGGGGGGHRGGSLPSFPQFTNHYEATFGGLGGFEGAGSQGASPSYSGGGGGAGAGHGGGAGHGAGAGGNRYSGHQGAPAGGHGHQGGGASLGGLGGGHGGSSSFLSGLGSSGHGGGSLPDISSLGSSYSGPMFTASNPYQPHTTGPVNAGFDLGNGGQFTINFAPGVGQEYDPSGGAGSYSGGGGQGGQGRGY